MNRTINFGGDERESDDRSEFHRAAPRSNERARQADYSRRKRPSGYNGIHRRHNKRWTW